MFEELGFEYVGPIDGHKSGSPAARVRNVRDTSTVRCSFTCVTQKGKGYQPAETSVDKYHGVVKFDVVTGVQAKAKSNAPSYTKVFAESLIKEARKDDKIVAITAAMPSGTGLDLFGKEFPTRTFDVGIAEQHAVTFAAGLATEGYKPFAAIYSTFLQRAYDQVVHDVAIQRLPVRFSMDRADSSAPTARPMPAGSTSRISAACRVSSSWRRRTRRNSCTWSRRKSRSTTAPRRCATRAARGSASRCRNSACRSKSARAASCARATRSRCCRSARVSPNA